MPLLFKHSAFFMGLLCVELICITCGQFRGSLALGNTHKVVPLISIRKASDLNAFFKWGVRNRNGHFVCPWCDPPCPIRRPFTLLDPISEPFCFLNPFLILPFPLLACPRLSMFIHLSDDLPGHTKYCSDLNCDLLLFWDLIAICNWANFIRINPSKTPFSTPHNQCPHAHKWKPILLHYSMRITKIRAETSRL